MGRHHRTPTPLDLPTLLPSPPTCHITEARESRLIDAAEEVNARAMSGFTHKDRAVLLSLLRRLGSNLD